MAFRYRKFKVYQDALAFHRKIVQLVKRFPAEYRHMADQMKRAALSVPLNIAEGSAKESDRDFNRFIAMSLGSMNEIVACSEASLAETLISDAEFVEIERDALEICNQLGGLSKKLRS